MTTKKGIRIIRHMLPNPPIEYGISVNLAWNDMHELPSGIAVKNDFEPLKSKSYKRTPNDEWLIKLGVLLLELDMQHPIRIKNGVLTNIT